MKTISDGWHTFHGWEVYTENGRILRGVTGGEFDRRPVWPYRPGRHGGWTSCEGITYAAAQSLYYRGRIDFH